MEFRVYWKLSKSDDVLADYQDGEWEWSVIGVFKNEPITQEKGLSLVQKDATLEDRTTT